jgi:arylsulfatase A-like enzyme
MNKYLVITGIYIVTFPHSFAQGLDLQKMNILYIQADQHRYDCVGFSKKCPVKTPNIDRLASEGSFFSNSFSCIPTSCPARQSLISGKWPEQHHGLWNYDITLPTTPFEGPTWTKELSTKNINMGYVGKWHVSQTKTPLDFGFNDYIPEGAYNTWRKQNKLPDYIWLDSLWVMGGYDPVNKMQSRTHWLAQKVVDLIRKYNEEGKPWFIRFDTSDPHLPCYPVKEFLDQYKKESIPEWNNYKDPFINKPYIQRQQIYNWRLENSTWNMWQGYLQRYFANISQLDDAVGYILDELKKLGLMNNTIIIYTTDHGDAGGCHNMVDKHYVMYEEEVHIPLIIKIPGQHHKVINQFVNNQLDMAATFCDIYHLNYQTQGTSLLTLLEGNSINWREYAFSDYNGQQFGLYVERMIRDKRMKYVWNLTDIDELYDLEKDPYEINNLINDLDYKKDLIRLRKALYEDLKLRNDPLIWQDAAKRQLLENVKLSR